MKVGEICTREVVTIDRHSTLIDAARLMRDRHVGDVVLVEEKESSRVPVGLVTDRDIVVAAIADGADLATMRVEQIAARDLSTADADDDVAQLMSTMHERGIRRVPVVNSLGALVGIVTYDDLVAWMADELARLAKMFQRQR